MKCKHRGKPVEEDAKMSTGVAHVSRTDFFACKHAAELADDPYEEVKETTNAK